MVKLLRITATEHIFGSAIGLVYRGSGRLSFDRVIRTRFSDRSS
jgi:hypothetical protein